MKDRSKYNEYMNAYMKRRWKARREAAISSLGGKCSICGSSESLEFDHVDKSTKVGSIAKMSSMSEVKFQQELSKCQLLCRSCHKRKSTEFGDLLPKDIVRRCGCGKMFNTTRSFAGHRTWCKL